MIDRCELFVKARSDRISTGLPTASYVTLRHNPRLGVGLALLADSIAAATP